MKVKGKYPESFILYAVFLAVGLIAAVVVFIVVLNLTGGSVSDVKLPASSTTKAAVTTPKEDKNDSGENDDSYDPGKDITDEMKDAVEKLLVNNYEVLTLYYTAGLPHKEEPYGNRPEDGYYSVDSDTYTSLAQIEAIVDATFEKSFAREIKTDPLGYGAIYKTRDNGDLGIIENFTPMVYDRSWENPGFSIKPSSETECSIEVTLHKKSDGSEEKVEASMIKGSDGWRLVSIVF